MRLDWKVDGTGSDLQLSEKEFRQPEGSKQFPNLLKDWKRKEASDSWARTYARHFVKQIFLTFSNKIAYIYSAPMSQALF